MVCQRCLYEFCWTCCGSYKDHKHEDTKSCFECSFAKGVCVLIAEFSIGVKLFELLKFLLTEYFCILDPKLSQIKMLIYTVILLR